MNYDLTYDFDTTTHSDHVVWEEGYVPDCFELEDLPPVFELETQFYADYKLSINDRERSLVRI